MLNLLRNKRFSFILTSFCFTILFLYIPISGVGEFYKKFTLLASETKTAKDDPLSLFFLYGREGLLGLFYLAFIIRLLIKREKIVQIRTQFLLLGAGVLGFCLSLLLYPPVVWVSGLRIFEYFPIIFIVPLLYKWDPKIINRINSIIQILVIFEFLVCVVEFFIMPPNSGDSILISRTVGTFSNPNTLGLFFSICFFWILFIAESKKVLFWFIICLIGIISTGSRTAILVFSAINIIFLIQKNKNSIPAKGVILTLSFFGLFIFFQYVNIISARSESIESIFQDPRFDVFLEYFSGISPFTFLFGKGLGIGTNTLYSFMGEAAENISPISDSMILSALLQFGLIGLLCVLIFFLVLSKITKNEGIALLFIIGIVSLTNAWFEVYPFNLMVFTIYGFLLGKGKQTFLKIPSRMKFRYESTSLYSVNGPSNGGAC